MVNKKLSEVNNELVQKIADRKSEKETQIKAVKEQVNKLVADNKKIFEMLAAKNRRQAKLNHKVKKYKKAEKEALFARKEADRKKTMFSQIRNVAVSITKPAAEESEDESESYEDSEEYADNKSQHSSRSAKAPEPSGY